MLPVSVPSHCALMQPAAEKLKVELEAVEIHNPEIPVVNNVDVATESSVDVIRAALERQLYSPVRWVETIEYMYKEGIENVVESGPGKVLTGLNRRIVKDMGALAVFDKAGLDKAISVVNQ